MTAARIVLVSVLLSVLAASGVIYFGSKAPTQSTANADSKETAFERVIRTGTIRCGYVVAKEFMIVDQNSDKLSGPVVDIVETMAKNLSLKVEWVAEVGPASMAEDLKRGRYDMICSPLTAIAARGRVVSFSRPVFFLPVYLWVRKDDPRAAQDFSWMNDKKITLAAIDGTSFAAVLQREFPQATILSLPEMTPITEMLVSVVTKKADVALMASVGGDFFAQQNDGAIVPAGNGPLYIQNHHFPLPHGDEKFRMMVDTALGEMIYSGSLNRILDRYDTSPPKYYWRVKPDYDALEQK